MDKKRFKNTKRELIHQAMRLKQSARYDWMRGTWDDMIIHCKQLREIQNNSILRDEKCIQ